MPKFHVTSPDGRTIEVDAPEGATEDQAIQYAQDNWETLSKGAAPQQPTPPEEGALQSGIHKAGDVALGMVETPLTLATGAVGGALGGLAQAGTSLYEAGREALGGEKFPGAAQAVGQDVAKAFTYKPYSESAKVSTEAAGTALSGFGALPAIAEKMRDTERQLTGGRTIGTDTALGVLSALPMGRGKGLLEDAAKGNLVAKTELANQVTATREKLYGKDVADAGHFMDKGFKIVPHEIKAGEKGTVAGVVEGVVGEKRVADEISKHNQEVSNNVAREDLGIAKDERLTHDALNEKKIEAFKPYEDIANYGKDLRLKFKFDDPLYQKLTSIEKEMTGTALAEERPSAESVRRVKRVVEEVKRDIYGEGDNMGKLSPAAAIEQIKKLREESSDIYKKKEIGTEEKEIAKVKYEAANALEDFMERKLPPEMVDNFRAARKQLSKLHTYGEILNPETGNINIRKLSGARYEKKFMIEGLGDLRKFATKYKASSKPETQQRAHGVSPIEAGLMAYDVIKHPIRSALVAARTGARPLLTSGPVQRAAIPKIEVAPSKTSRVLAGAAKPTTQAAVVGATAAEQERARRKRERANK